VCLHSKEEEGGRHTSNYHSWVALPGSERLAASHPSQTALPAPLHHPCITFAFPPLPHQQQQQHSAPRTWARPLLPAAPLLLRLRRRHRLLLALGGGRKRGRTALVLALGGARLVDDRLHLRPEGGLTVWRVRGCLGGMSQARKAGLPLPATHAQTPTCCGACRMSCARVGRLTRAALGRRPSAACCACCVSAACAQTAGMES